MIALIDYGAGNLRSVANALEALTLSYRICAAPDDLAGTTRVVLPGVGHFGAAARTLESTGLAAAIADRAARGTPLLGICLGLHLLFARSAEAPGERGLGLLPGDVVRLDSRRVPHMGWNRVFGPNGTGAPGIAGPGDADYFYFAHSYVVQPERAEDHLAFARIEDRTVPVMVGRGAILGVQFHPEKSGPAGLRLLGRFATC